MKRSNANELVYDARERAMNVHSTPPRRARWVGRATAHSAVESVMQLLTDVSPGPTSESSNNKDKAVGFYQNPHKMFKLKVKNRKSPHNEKT